MKNVHWAFSVFKRSDCTVVQLSTLSYVGTLLKDDHVHKHHPIKVLLAWLICSMCCEISLIHHKVIVRQYLRDESSVYAAAFILTGNVTGFCVLLHIWCEWNLKHFASICLANSCLSATYNFFEMGKPIFMDFDPRSFFISTRSELDNTTELQSGDGAVDHTSLPTEQPPNESQTDEAPHSPRDVMSIADIITVFKRSAYNAVELTALSYVAALLFDDHVHEHHPIKVLLAWLINSMCYEISLIHHKVIVRQYLRDESSVYAAALIFSGCEAAFCALLHIWCEWNLKHFASICLANSSLSATYYLFEMGKPILMDFDPRSFFLSTSSVLDNTPELESGDGAVDHASLPTEQQPPNESQTDEAPHSPRDVMSIASILSWFQ
jgi:hypothetical protein